MLTRYTTKGKIVFVSGFHRIERCSGNRIFAVPTPQLVPYAQLL